MADTVEINDGYENLKRVTKDKNHVYEIPTNKTGSKVTNDAWTRKKWIVMVVVIITVAVVICVGIIIAVVLTRKCDNECPELAQCPKVDNVTTVDAEDNPKTCAENPCQNNGLCVTVYGNSFACICLNDTLYGNRCEKELPPLHPQNCRVFKDNVPGTKSGLHVVRIGQTDPIVVYCDQETEGGGWTLVYSYGFTQYNSFNDTSNAVTPIPNWPGFSTTVTVSTVPPLKETWPGALDFSLWKFMGSEFMVKTNINNWLRCSSTGGSLVELTYGSIQCEVIKVVQNCSTGNIVPTSLGKGPVGPQLNNGPLANVGKDFYYWDGNVERNWPTHDPCGEDDPNQKKNVANPYGAIYIR